eukprot:TRINITY_DN13517_c0_g1_i10.p1 TRINITY_DN13517_c0_g1~~TRINITY_DN13517_c0_g1_i10.p1  ORF type:complete len:243 (-),score=16.01 TRINITY_DN13517_c0_g1_i10:1381-2109(-)
MVVRTHSFFLSLSTIEDSFDVLVVDEISADGTIQYIQKRNIKYIRPEESMGVTHNWNLAYEYFMTHNQYDIMYISNNDVLVPNGAIDELSKSLKNCDCDLVSPLSTMWGKGHRKLEEGLETIFGVDDTKIQHMVNQDINYQSVQNALTQFKEQTNVPQCQLNLVQDTFNGFFYGFKKDIQRIAFNQTMLFDPANKNIHQENDLTDRLRENSMKICLNTYTFIFHYKASTIPMYIDRNAWVKN